MSLQISGFFTDQRVSFDSRRNIFNKLVEDVPAKISMSRADKEGAELVRSTQRRNGRFKIWLDQGKMNN